MPTLVNYTELVSMLHWDLEPYLSGNPFMSSDMSVTQVNALALADSFYKKLCPNGNSRAADDAALKKFKAINARISTDPFSFAANDEQEATFWDYFKNNFRNALQFEVEGTNFDLAFIRENMAVGPGASQKAVDTDFISKLFMGPVSYTSEFLIPLYRSALADTGLWAEAELLRSSKFPFVKVNGGKLFFAKKNAEISRTCCTESNLGMLIQMAIGAFFEERLIKYFGISLSTQPDANRELARQGSIYGTYGTIDLVSASDSISWQLMLHVLEDGFLKRAIIESRSEKAVLPDGSEVVLNMISTMGNGFTFPLQTLIFASAVKSVYEMMNLRATTKVYAAKASHPLTSYGVFGDDIVVCSEAYGFVTKMLNKLGFEVNHAKSFSSGPFRESCGHDWFRGSNVRGVYIRDLETPQAAFSAVNRLLRWSARTGIPLVRTVNYIRGNCRGSLRDLRVPPSESDDAGFKVPFRATSPVVQSNYWFRYRYSKRLTRRVRLPDGSRTDLPNVERLAADSRSLTASFGAARFGVDPYRDNTRLTGDSSTAVGLAHLGGYARRPSLSLTELNSSCHLMGMPIDDKSRAAQISKRDPSGARPRYKLAKKDIPFWDLAYDPERGRKAWKQWYDPLDEEDQSANPDEFRTWVSTVLAHLSW